jgi:protein-ribulosamine 3-kinase
MDVQQEIANRIREVVDVSVRAVEPLGTSFAARLYRVRSDGGGFALKWAAPGQGRVLEAEARGLRLLADAKALRIPAVRAVHAPADGEQAFLLIEWLDGNGARPDMARLGSELAALHGHSATAYGLDHDNYLGGSLQDNTPHLDWVDFYRERRLLPQIRLAERNALLPLPRRRMLERLLARLDELLAGVERQPALSHGDLWAGNVVAADASGTPALIDPAVAFCDREPELAFTELFGGFGPRFLAAYQEAWPLEAGYPDRRPLYQLYHLLNHLNLFGEGYGSQVDAIARHYAG